MYGVLFVCTGNICRSPTAHGVFRELVKQAGLQDKIRVDSAAISAYHTGQAPDPRAIQTALAHGVPLYDLRARPVCAKDFEDFDLMIAMDSSHFRRLNEMRPKNAQKPVIARMMSYALEYGTPDVPDPYFDGGFNLVFDMIDAACRNLLDDVRAQTEKENG